MDDPESVVVWEICIEPPPHLRVKRLRAIGIRHWNYDRLELHVTFTALAPLTDSLLIALKVPILAPMYSLNRKLDFLQTHIRRHGCPAHDELAPLAAPFRASMALTEFANAFSKTPLPIVPSTMPSSHPLRFLPSRTTTTSMPVKPSGRRVKV